MEFAKIRSYLLNNDDVNENKLLELINDNSIVNINKVINYCAVGDVGNSLFFYNKTIESSISSVALIRAFIRHFKIIEKIHFGIHEGSSIDTVIKNIKPPIFFKDQPTIIYQTKLWNLNRTNLILRRLVDTEIKSKLGIFVDKLLVAQFILSTSVMIKNSIKS
jgi:DNA polymerase-3 subunit delta